MTANLPAGPVSAIVNPRSLPLLYVDDQPENLELFRLQFGQEFAVHTATSGAAALDRLGREDFALLLTDERMPALSGIDLLSRVVDRWPDVVRVIVSAYGDAQRLLSAINRGHAHEYVLKPWNRDELAACLDRGLTIAARRRALAARAEVSQVLDRDAREAVAGGDAIVAGGGMEPVMSLARRAAGTDATVLITGETGTGKEVVARFIHENSPRSAEPFIRVNCGALADGLLESELFGHEAGAFTGAQRMRRGRFELAQGGTIFLDEIGDISPRTQVLLLRALQEREIERVGSATPIRVRARVIAATHRDLPQRIAAGTFREDFYYRLNVVPISIPPLRERRQGIAALIQHFIAKHARRDGRPRLHPDVVASLTAYDWPGNVRELENLVQRALVLCSDDLITVDDFCFTVPACPPVADVRDQVREAETAALRQLIVSHGGNLARAARALNVPRTTLVSRAKKFGLVL
jgi:DNA-binding NtrC family response regulator